MLTELKEGAWVDYRSNWLESGIADALLADLSRDQHWIQKPIIANGKSVMQPRLMQWGGAVAYKYSGLTLEPRPMSKPMQRLCEQLNREWGVEFNHVVLNFVPLRFGASEVQISECRFSYVTLY